MHSNSQQQNVILVDEKGQPIGEMEKMAAHISGDLHLAFSVLLYRKTPAGIEFLLQQRALGKYHSERLWTNTCCSHPEQNETILEAAIRRLRQEVRINAEKMPLKVLGSFIYRAELDNNLIEHELDHVVCAEIDDVEYELNPEEVMAVRWWPEAELSEQLNQYPERFSAWFSQVLSFTQQAIR